MANNDKKTQEVSFQDKLKAWWETDTAKAVATIIAVLLIPAAVIAWNYATTQGQDISNELATETTTEPEPEPTPTEEPAPVETETQPEPEPAPTETETQPEPAPEASAEPEAPAEPAPVETPVEEQPAEEEDRGNPLLVAGAVKNVAENIQENRAERNANETANQDQNQNANNEQAQGQEPATETPQTETNNQNQDQAQNQNPDSGNQQAAVGGLGSVEKLPNTDSTESYVVAKGDNVYRISLKVCGNDSFYRANKKMDYLKVGQTLEVKCY